MTFIEMVMAAALTVGALVGIALVFFAFIHLAFCSLKPKKRQKRQDDIDIIVSQARSRK